MPLSEKRYLSDFMVLCDRASRHISLGPLGPCASRLGESTLTSVLESGGPLRPAPGKDVTPPRDRNIRGRLDDDTSHRSTCENH